MKTELLNGTWQVKGKKQISNDDYISFPSQVPGCVQLDLSANGYLPDDLYMGENIVKAEEFEDFEWWYERSFTAPAEKKNVFLVFEGVDCIAEYFLNGVKIGESNNMFIRHEFRVDDYLQEGENHLSVHLLSPIIAAGEEEYTVKLLSSQMNIESSHIRKAPHSYGWDILPRLVSAGLWRDVVLEVRDNIYFSQTFFQTDDNCCNFLYTLECDINDFKDVEIELSGSCGENSSFSQRVACKNKYGSIPFTVTNPQKWFPYGYGDANVYDGTAKIFNQGKLVHEESISFGIRNIKLDYRESSGSDDGQFRILINGIEIMCKGSNWVPMDAFHCRDAQRYDNALALVKDIGCNILRCWGGNVYEDHHFFGFCDRNGIMIWQDFAMACRLYPENEKFKENIKAEVTSVIRKLRNHPSIILWAGDNEVDFFTPDCYNPNNNTITRQVIRKCIEENDMGRPYIPSSPYISEEMYKKGQKSQALGSTLVEEHLWGPRDYFKSDFYKSSRAHFISEIGYHGCPSLDSIKKFITPDRIWPYTNNSEWILHSSDQKGNDYRVMLLEQQIRQLFGEVPSEIEDFILASQISQAEAKKYFIERMRAGRPEKTGIIWWNLIDGWPQFSDAVIDYYYTKKLAYFYIKRSQSPFTICAGEISNWNLSIFACNDTLNDKQGHFQIIDSSTDEIIYEDTFYAKANATTKLTDLFTYYSEHKMLIFKWDIDGERGFNHYLCGYPPFSLADYKKLMEKYNLRG